MEIHTKIVEYLSTIDLSSNDHRLAYNKEAKVAYWFHTFMYDELLKSGRLCTGYVFRQPDEQCLLVVKSVYENIPQVVFCTGRNPIDCMALFCKKLYNDSLQWVKDKYA